MAAETLAQSPDSNYIEFSSSTLSSPMGEVRITGTNPHTGKVRLRSQAGYDFETSPEELGTWQMIAESGGRFREAEAAEDLGDVTAEKTLKVPESIKPTKIMRSLGQVATRYLEWLGSQSPLQAVGGNGANRPPEGPPAPPGPEDGQDFDWGDEEPATPYVSDWNYASHEDLGDKVKVRVEHNSTGEKKDVTVSKNYFNAWEKGEELPDEKAAESQAPRASSGGSLDRLRLIDYEPSLDGSSAVGEPESLIEKAKREREEDADPTTWSGHIEKMAGRPEDEGEGIPKEILAKAAESFVPISYLRQAEKNPHAARTLREKYGIVWGAEEITPKPLAGKEISEAEIAATNAAFGTKITPEYIKYARIELGRGNERPADFLKGLGINVTNSSEDQRMSPRDPVIEISEIGRARRNEILQLIPQIEQDPAAVRRTLERPAQVHGIFRLLPYGTTMNKRLLAYRIARKEMHEQDDLDSLASKSRLTEKELSRYVELGRRGIRKENEQAEFDSLVRKNTLSIDEADRYLELRRKGIEPAKSRDRGLLGIGLNLYRHNIHAINHLDESIKTHRRQLALPNRHELMGSSATKRRDLAWRVSDARRSVEQTKHLEIQDLSDPTLVHNHEVFKDKRKTLREANKMVE